MGRFVDEEDVREFRSKYWALSPEHCRLLDVCLERSKPKPIVEPLSSDELTGRDLENLKQMVEWELLSSMKAAFDGTEDASEEIEPHPFDLWLMKVTFEQMAYQKRPLALCLPIKEALVWYDGERTTWPLAAGDPKWRVASLSGAARTLQALSVCSGLKDLAMARQGLVDAVDIERNEDTGDVEGPAYLKDIFAKMNHSQCQAVATVVSPTFQEGFFAIQGPPGCGKTTTCVGMIKALLREQKLGRGVTSARKGKTILVAAPSNAAVANLALKLFKDLQEESINHGQESASPGLTGVIKKSFAGEKTHDPHVQTRQRYLDLFADLVVFGENCNESVRFLNPKFRGQYFARQAQKLEEKIKEKMKAVELSEELLSELRGQFVQEIATWLHLNPELDWSFAELSNVCLFIDMESKLGRSVYAELLTDSKVTFSTLNGSGSNQLLKNLRVGTIFLDEGGQCTEAEFYIAATFPSVSRVVVMGDPKQLPSTVIDQKCKQAGYGRSWLGNILRLRPNKVHLLNTQYRMDPRILQFPNRRFYDDRILSGDNVLSRSQDVENPFLFIDVNRTGSEEKDGFSWTNIYEVAVIKSLLFTDRDIKAFYESSDIPVRIIVITPYKAQVNLLQQTISVPHNCAVEIATVDSFQGQEADIVILSTVRTYAVGFVDDSHRLNVALTRAKRILRVVGDADFFLMLRPPSTLNALVRYSNRVGLQESSKLEGVPWSRPNWSQPTIWEVCLTSRFHDCINKMTERKRNIALNTLLALARGNRAALSSPIQLRTEAGWYTSGLKRYANEAQVVWIAKDGIPPIIEAVFTGIGKECRRFLQLNNNPPGGACIAKPSLAGLVLGGQARAAKKQNEIMDSLVSWSLNNSLQTAMVKGSELSVGSMKLDQDQQLVAQLPPPLLIESRSGTGKTLVLQQHNAYYADYEDERPSCFVTVSPRLRNSLEKEYAMMNTSSNNTLKPTLFFTLKGLLSKLIQAADIVDFVEKSHCSFLGFATERFNASHQKPKVESHLIESEIGGVIMGSLEAAISNSPLSRNDYLGTKRSNIGRSTNQDTVTREYIYEQFEQYSKWKSDNMFYDQGDIVMRLLEENWPQLFSAAYLDEIQDLSYACIFLLCHVAGKENQQWICAGDPAQMISPGCSFHFDGLKQTLRAVQIGIDEKLGLVSQLLVNYRTTRAVLELANKVLAVARQRFPMSIPFARTEIANKDLGLRVVICDWSVAFRERIELGANQAVVYSSIDPETLQIELKEWIGNHPFVMTALDSKGLEFDDVIVAFDYDRNVWRVGDGRVASLRMLRELYVAVTRAKRRVVILQKACVPEMSSFFESLECDFQTTDTEFILKQFKNVTRPEEWLAQGISFFEEENFRMAARCFESAREDGWGHWSQGKSFAAAGIYVEAAKEYSDALASFGRRREYDLVLEVSLALTETSVATHARWDASHDMIKKYVEEALLVQSNKMQRSVVVRIALATEVWSEVTVADIRNCSLSNYFLPFRGSAHMKEKLEGCTQDDLDAIEKSLPCIVADHYLERSKFPDAVRIYLKARAYKDGIGATMDAVRDCKRTSICSALSLVVKQWTESGVSPEHQTVATLVKLFQGVSTAASSIANDCLHDLGKDVILAVVDFDPDVDRLILHKFSQTQFFHEVSETLLQKYKLGSVEVAEWFLSHHDRSSALTFVQKRLTRWKQLDLLRLLEAFLFVPPWFFEWLSQKKLLFPCVAELLASKSLDIESKEKFARSFSSFQKKKERKEADAFHVIAAVISQLIDELLPRKRPEKHTDDAKVEWPLVLSHKLMYAWPRRNATVPESSKPQQQEKFNFTESLCEGLVSTSIESCPHRNYFLKLCMQNNTANKASGPLVRLCLRFERTDLALQITAGVIKSKNLTKFRRGSVLEAWKSYLRQNPRTFVSADVRGNAVRDIAGCLIELSQILKSPDETVGDLLRGGNFNLGIAFVRLALFSGNEVFFNSAFYSFVEYTSTLGTKDIPANDKQTEHQNYEDWLWLIIGDPCLLKADSSIDSLSLVHNSSVALPLLAAKIMRAESPLQNEMMQLKRLYDELDERLAVHIAISSYEKDTGNSRVRKNDKESGTTGALSVGQKKSSLSWFEEQLKHSWPTHTESSNVTSAHGTSVHNSIPTGKNTHAAAIVETPESRLQEVSDTGSTTPVDSKNSNNNGGNSKKKRRQRAKKRKGGKKK